MSKKTLVHISYTIGDNPKVYGVVGNQFAMTGIEKANQVRRLIEVHTDEELTIHIQDGTDQISTFCN